MAFAVTALTVGNNNTDLASYATASVTPTAGSRPVIFFVVRRAAAPNLGTVSGNGLTWTLLGDVAFNGGGQFWRIAAYIGSGTPSAGAITMAFAAQVQLECVWSVFEVADNPVVVQTPVAASGTSTTPLATLAAFSDPNNLTLGLMGGDGFGTAAITATPGSGFTQIHQKLNAPSQNSICFTEKKATADTTVDASLTESVLWGMIAVELGTNLTPINLSDTATAAEGLSASATLTGSDSVTGAEATAMSATASLAEPVSVAEAPTATAMVSLAETATASEALAASVTAALLEAVAAAESPAVSVTLGLSDAATQTRALTVTATVTGADPVTAAELLSANASLSLQEAATGSDAALITNLISVADGVTLAEALSLLTILAFATGVGATEATDLVVYTVGGSGGVEIDVWGVIG